MLSKYSLRLPKVVYGGREPHRRARGGAAPRRAPRASSCSRTPSLHKLGLVNPVLEAVEAAGATYEIVDDIPAEPTYAQVQSVVDQVKSASADAIVAVGGGSVMDAAKLAGVCATDAYTVHDLLADPSRAAKQLTTFMVPTTAGTGAEATPNAIVAVPEDELKVGIVNDAMIADYVVLDARMIKNLPRPIAASTGIDALCHAIECYTSTKANPFSDVFALEAFDLIVNNIEAACDDPEAMDAKRAMQIASFYAGIAITASGTTAVHALSYPLGGKYHVAHGVSNAILLSPVMHFNEPAIRERLAVAYDRAIHGDAATVEEKSAAVIERMDAHREPPRHPQEARRARRDRGRRRPACGRGHDRPAPACEQQARGHARGRQSHLRAGPLARQDREAHQND